MDVTTNLIMRQSSIQFCWMRTGCAMTYGYWGVHDLDIALLDKDFSGLDA